MLYMKIVILFYFNRDNILSNVLFIQCCFQSHVAGRIWTAGRSLPITGLVVEQLTASSEGMGSNNVQVGLTEFVLETI